MEGETENPTTVRQVCDCCEIEITGTPVVRDGKTYCCEGCAGGGPCTCDYTQKEPAPGTAGTTTTSHFQIADVLKECATLLEVWEQHGDTSSEETVDDVLAKASYALRDAAKTLAGDRSEPASALPTEKTASSPATVTVAKRAPGEEIQHLVQRVTGKTGQEDDTIIIIDDDVLSVPDSKETTGFELGVDVFLNARHRVLNDRNGEIHPHSWRIQARLIDTPEQSKGTLTSSSEVRELVEQCLAPYYDKLLNQIRPFDTLSPTPKNMAAAFYQQVNEALAAPSLKLEALCVWDTPTSYVTYREAA